MKAGECKCIVQSRRTLTPTVFELIFEIESKITFEAGQFISVIIPGAGPQGRDLRRAYSIASSPSMYPFELCIKLVEGGPGTNYLNSLNPGDVFKGFAPYGNFTFEAKEKRHACFLATGTGIAPFRSMILSEEFKKNPPLSSLCILGVRTEDELLYSQELSSIPGVKWVETVSQPSSQWEGFKGRLTDYMRTFDSDYPWLNTDYYLCGNGAMIQEVKEMLTQKGVDKKSIYQEVYYK